MKTLIMCGGRGARLRPLTDQIPKPLIPLYGRPILQHILERYLRKGFREFVLCIGYRGDAIREFVLAQRLDADIQFSDAGEHAGILARLAHARDLMGERAFVAYGDTLIDVDLHHMATEHAASGAAVTLTTAMVRSPFGLVASDPGGRVVAFEEKPLQTFFVGHMLIERRALDGADPDLLGRPDGEGLVGFIQHWVAAGQARQFHYDGPSITFNTTQELREAERDAIAFFTHQEGAGP